jgi:hypothetical protein
VGRRRLGTLKKEFTVEPGEKVELPDAVLKGWPE